MFWYAYGLYGIHTTIIPQCWRFGIGAIKSVGKELAWGKDNEIKL